MCTRWKSESFSLGGTSVALVVFAPWRTSAPPRPGVGDPVAPAGIVPRKGQYRPSFWGTSIVRLHMFHSDAGRTARTRPLQCSNVALRASKAKTPTKGLSTLNSMAFGLAASTVRGMVGFAVRVTPTPRKTHFRSLVRRYRTGFPPARFLRKVSDSLPNISSSFPKLT